MAGWQRGGVFILTDNLSTAVIVMAITCVLIFVAHPKTKPFLVIAAIGAGILIVIVAILAVYATNSDNFRIGRITTWLDPEGHSDGTGFQVLQGLYAIGSGDFSEKVLETARRSLV